jgi:hypothetical protein
LRFNSSIAKIARFAALIFLAPALVLCATAQQPAATSEQGKSPAPQGAQQPLSMDSGRTALESPVFNQEVAEAVMQRLGDALKAHNFSRTRALFDLRRFPAAFQNDMSASFDHYDRFRLFYRIESTSGTGATGSIVSQFDLECEPPPGNLDLVRRHATLQIQVERVRTSEKKDEWRIVTMQPAGFLFHF